MDIKERLKYITEKSGLSRMKLSKYLEVSYSVLDNIARGQTKKFPPDLAKVISEKMGYSFEWLMTGDGDIMKKPVADKTPITPELTPEEKEYNNDLEEVAEDLKISTEALKQILETTKEHTELVSYAIKAINGNKKAFQFFCLVIRDMYQFE